MARCGRATLARPVVVLAGVVVWLASWATLAAGQAPPASRPYLSPTLDTAGLIAVLDEPAWGNRTVELYRKRQACDRLNAATPDVGRAVPALVHLLHDERAAQPAAAALGRLGSLAVDDVLAAARDDDPTCRRYAVRALAVLPIATAGPALEDLSRSDPDPVVNRWATFALCDLKSPAAGPAVAALLRDGNRAARMETLQAIARWPLTDEAAAAVANLVVCPDPELSDRATGLLLRDRPPFTTVAAPLCSAARWGDGRPGEAAALQVLLGYPDAQFGAVDLAIRCLTSPNGQSQSFALRMLQAAKPADLGPYLFPLACLSQNRNANVQQGNVRAAYVRGCNDYAAGGPTDGPLADRTLNGLASVLDDTRLSSDLKNPALRALARFGPRARRAVPAAAVILGGDAFGGDRVAAAEFLTTLAPAGATADAAALRAIGDGTDDVRLAAERYLLAEPTAAVPLLPKLVGDSRPDVRAVGLDLAGRLPAGDADLTRRVSALTADPAGDVRLTAWSLLNTWTHGTAAAAVLKVLAEHPPATALAAGDPNPRLRSEAHAVATIAGFDFSAPSPPQPAASPLPRAGSSWHLGPAAVRTARVAAEVAAIVLLVMALAAVAVVWLLARSAARHVGQHEPSPEVAAAQAVDPRPAAHCVRCRAVLPSTSRYCRRCGLVTAAT